MVSCRLPAMGSLVVLMVIAQGCSSGNSGGGSGLTDAELKKMMEPGEAAGIAPAQPVVLELSAEETMKLLTNPMSAEAAQKSIAENKRRVTGKILELSPADSESPFVMLDGGTHGGKAYKVKCTFAADQSEEVKQLKAGDESRIDGASDGVIRDNTLEFKNCTLSSTSMEKTPGNKP